MSQLLNIPHNILESLSKNRRFLLSYTVYTQSMKQHVVKCYQRNNEKKKNLKPYNILLTITCTCLGSAFFFFLRNQ